MVWSALPFLYARVPYYCEWIEQTTRGEVQCQTERAGEQPSPIPPPTPIEETTNDEIMCQPEEGSLPALRYDINPTTLALYRDNGTRACYSLNPVRMCKHGLQPRNQVREIVPFICLHLGFTPSVPLPHTAVCLRYTFFSDTKYDEYLRLFAINSPTACGGDEEKDLTTSDTESTTSPTVTAPTSTTTPSVTASIGSSIPTTTESVSHPISVNIRCSPGEGNFTLRAEMHQDRWTLSGSESRF